MQKHEPLSSEICFHQILTPSINLIPLQQEWVFHVIIHFATLFSQDSKKGSYEKLDQTGDAGEEEAKKEAFIKQDQDPESKPPKEKAPPGARRSTYKSIGIALLIVIVVVAIIGVVAAVLICK